MKLLLIALLILPFKLLSQESGDSLKKYTYYIAGVVIDDRDSLVGYTQASGFFLIENSKMYFVTAKHVLSGFSDSCKKILHPPSIMNITLHDENGKFIEFLNINVKKVIDTTPCSNPHLVPDFIMLQIRNFEKYKIFSVEKYLPSNIPKVTGYINIFGFPSTSKVDTVNNIEAIKTNRVSNLKFSNYQLQTYTRSSVLEVPVDTINYRIITRDIIIDKSLKGYSGSPVFIEDKLFHRWVFIGIFSSTDITHSLYVVKPGNFLRE